MTLRPFATALLAVTLTACVSDFKTGMPCATDADCVGLVCSDRLCASAHAPPTTLEVTVPASAVTAGASALVTVEARTAKGNRALGFSEAGAVALPGDANATGAGALAFTDGLASVNVIFEKAGAQDVQVTAPGMALVSGTIVVEPGAVAGFGVTGVPTSLTSYGAMTLTVTAQDPYQNRVPGYAGLVRVDTQNAADPNGGIHEHRYVAGDAGSFDFVVEVRGEGSRSLRVSDQEDVGVEVYTATTTVLPLPMTPVISLAARVDPYGTGTATVTANPGMTYEWTISGPATAGAGGLAGVTSGGVNTLSFTTAGEGTVTVTCREVNGLGDAGGVGSREAAAGCAQGRALCGGTSCLDLATDPANCGACGYGVISTGDLSNSAHRECVNGKPSPGWVPINMTNGPTGPPTAAFWTGKRMVHVDATVTKAYDPATDTWSSFSASPVKTAAASRSVQIAPMPDRVAAFLVGSEGAAMLDDSGPTPTWTMFPGFAYSDVFASTYTGSQVWVSRLLASTYQTQVNYVNLANGVWSPAPLVPIDGDGWVNGMTYAKGQVAALQAGAYYSGETETVYATGKILNPASPDAWATRRSTRHSNNDWCFGQTWLGVGSAIFLYGGTYFGFNNSSHSILDQGAILFDPSSGTTVDSTVPSPAYAASGSFALFTGRSVFLWGGTQTTAVSNVTSSLAGGAIGVVSSGSVTWATLPASSAQPSARAWSDDGEQHLWTGREALVYGGGTGCGRVQSFAGGSRYQPPVGCICPTNLDAPPWFASQCDGISKIADATCTP